MNQSRFFKAFAGRWRLSAAAALFAFALSACGDSVNNLERVRILSIVVNCRAYATDHDGKYPEKLDDLHPRYIDLADNFYSPPRNETETEVQPYYYRPGLLVDSKIDEPMVVSPHVVKGKVNVGYRGGFIRKIDYTEAQKILADIPGWVRKAPPLSKVAAAAPAK